MLITAFVLAPALQVGCTFDEHLPQVDITGTVVVPREAATRTIVDPRTGEPETVTDSRFIGPVWLGAYSDINTTIYDYPHPAEGPVFSPDVPADTYPYGGGSVGYLAFACVQDLTCRLTTGRFETFDSILEFFDEVMHDPIRNDANELITSGEYFREICYDLFNYTADYELGFLGEVDFQENNDGDFEAEFNLWHTDYTQGMKVWGWMDAPSSTFGFSTCDPDRGERNTEYANDYQYGASYIDLLNHPNVYIRDGDWVVGEPWEATAVDADAFRIENPSPTIRLDFPIQAEE